MMVMVMVMVVSVVMFMVVGVIDALIVLAVLSAMITSLLFNLSVLDVQRYELQIKCYMSRVVISSRMRNNQAEQPENNSREQNCPRNRHCSKFRRGKGRPGRPTAVPVPADKKKF